jgi:hypothetical protein
MPAMIEIKVSSAVECSILLNKDKAFHTGFSSEQEAQIWAAKMAKKIEKYQTFLRKETAIFHEFLMAGSSCFKTQKEESHDC